MFNEELVAMIQSGGRDRLIELWQQIRRMALKEAIRWAAYRSNGVELEDLEQAGFIALMRAVDGFDSAAGTRFSTWYHRVLLTEFAAATGRRTERQRRDLLQSAVSLDAPVDREDTDAVTIGDLMPDPAAEAAITAVDERDRLARLHADLKAVLSELPEDLRETVRRKYWLGLPVDNKAHSAALRALRHPRVSMRLREYTTI